MFFSILAMLAALLPSFMLCAYVYYKDRVEKEPFSLLLTLFALGAVAFIPALLIDNALLNVLGQLFHDKITYSNEGVIIYSDTGVGVVHQILRALFGYSIIDELFKWLVLVVFTRKNKNFNSLFDGIIYAVCVSLGFAVSDSIAYFFNGGEKLFLLRALEDLPSQIFFGLIMGMFYTLWHAYSIAKKEEKRLLADGTLSEERVSSGSLFLVLSILVPIIAHAVFSLVGSNPNVVSLRIAYSVFIIAAYICFFIITERFSKKDASDYMAAQRIIIKKHPEYAFEKEAQE